MAFALGKSIAYWCDGVLIQWSQHAVERACERFGNIAMEFPNRRIVKAFRLVEVEEEFRVRTFLTTFVCTKTEEQSVLIKTVLFNGMEGRMQK